VICLLPHCGYLSSTSRMLEIHRALRARGYSARIATHGGPYESVLREAGVAYDIVGPPMSPARCAEFVRTEVGRGNIGQSMYSDEELRTYVRAEARYFADHGIRVAVTGFTLSTLLSTRLSDVALVTEHAGSWVPPAYERGLLPAPATPLTPALRALPRPAMRWLSNAVPPRVKFYCGGFNRIATELGVPGVPSLGALVLGDLSLVPEVPEVLGIPAADLDAWEPGGRRGYRPGTRLRYTGPLYARLGSDLPARVRDFLDTAGPTVYVAMTSTPLPVVRQVVARVAALGVRVLVAATVHDLGNLAGRRVMVAPVLPSHLVMPHVDLAVTAGGQGSVQTAMATGTPVLGIPMQPEQDLNLVLLERHGAARRIAPRHAVGPALTRTARQMLADDRYRAGARRIQKCYDGVDGPGNAAEAIIGLTAPAPRRPPATG
jgi:UDP:flavonoid glycosyltransferase YjiC (YdhE family)